MRYRIWAGRCIFVACPRERHTEKPRNARTGAPDENSFYKIHFADGGSGLILFTSSSLPAWISCLVLSEMRTPSRRVHARSSPKRLFQAAEPTFMCRIVVSLTLYLRYTCPEYAHTTRAPCSNLAGRSASPHSATASPDIRRIHALK